MKYTLLCDSKKLMETLPLCEKYHLGIEAQGFDGVQFMEEHPDIVEVHKEALKNIEHRSIHGLFWDLVPGSSDPLIQAVVRQRFEEAYDQARAIGADNIVVHHGGYVHGIFTQKTSQGAWDRRSVEFWKDFLKDKDPSVHFHVENLLEPDPESLLYLAENVNMENLDINLDIGHVNYASDIPVVDWIKRLNKHIGYVHIHDNMGLEDVHHGLGRGNLPLVDIFDALEEYAPDAIWSLEPAQCELEESIIWLQEHGYLPVNG